MKSLTILDQARETFLAPIEQELQNALPATVDARRFQSAFITAVQNNPQILKCAPDSVRNALMKCASDGLVPDGRQAAMVPFNNNGMLMAQYIPMYQGIIARARELGDVLSITANCVFKRDEFVVDETDVSSMTHKRPPLNEDRGEILGAYCIFRDKEGRVIHREIMDRSEIEKSRSISRAKNSPAWNAWFGEMARKTVIRRGAKYIPMSDALRKIIEREDEHVALDRSERPDRTGFNPLVIDATAAQPQEEPRKIQDSGQATSALSAGGGGPEIVPRQSGTGTTAPEQTGPSSPLPTGWAHAYIAVLKRASQPKSLSQLAAAFWKPYGGYNSQSDAVKAIGGPIYTAFTECLGGKMDFKELDAKLREVVGDDDTPNADAKEKGEQDVGD